MFNNTILVCPFVPDIQSVLLKSWCKPNKETIPRYKNKSKICRITIFDTKFLCRVWTHFHSRKSSIGVIFREMKMKIVKNLNFYNWMFHFISRSRKIIYHCFISFSYSHCLLFLSIGSQITLNSWACKLSTILFLVPSISIYYLSQKTQVTLSLTYTTQRTLSLQFKYFYIFSFIYSRYIYLYYLRQ